MASIKTTALLLIVIPQVIDAVSLDGDILLVQYLTKLKGQPIVNTIVCELAEYEQACEIYENSLIKQATTEHENDKLINDALLGQYD